MAWTVARRPFLVVSFLAVLLAPFLAWQAAQGGEQSIGSAFAPRGIVVVGDSITAKYNDRVGDDRQGWWSLVGRRYGAEVTTYAQSGSGYLRPGLRCTGDRFIDRPDVYAGRPSIVIVEGGRNDWAVCSGGELVPAADDQIAHAVDRYLSTLRAFLPRSTRVLVLGPPWGPVDRADGERVTRIVKEAARRHGMEFVSTDGTLGEDEVYDGIHPNRLGSVAIADRVIRALG